MKIYLHEGEHSHSHAEGAPHTHAEEAPHSHSHTHTQTKAVLNRLARLTGHLESVKTMVREGRDCAEVLVQIAAVRSALSATAKVILRDHIEHCLTDAIETGDVASVEALNEAIEKFL